MDKRAAYYFQAFKKIKKNYLEYAKQELKQFNLSPNEIEVISVLGNSMCGSEVARQFDVSKTLVSRSVSYLAEKGFISVETGDDKREKILKLTENGTFVLKEIQSMQENYFKVVFNHFEEREMLVLEALLKLMLKNINE